MNFVELPQECLINMGKTYRDIKSGEKKTKKIKHSKMTAYCRTKNRKGYEND